MLRLRLPTLLASAVLALGAAACGGSDGGGGSGGGGSTGGGQSPQAAVDSGDPKAGETVFSESCAGCHGDDGGGGTGPALAGNADASDPERVVEQIREGGGGMPPFAGQLEDPEIADVSAYVVKTLSQK